MFDRRLSLPAIILSAISSTCICRETHARGRLLRAVALVAVLLGLCAAGAHAGPTDTTTTLQITSGGSEVTTVVWGSEVTLTAAVTSGGGLATGQVNFCDAPAPHCTDIHLLGTAQLTRRGRCYGSIPASANTVTSRYTQVRPKGAQHSSPAAP
jgi:hypothetical protein